MDVRRKQAAAPTAQQWAEYWSLHRFVWETKGLREGAKGAWDVLWWDLGLGRGGALDVTAAQIARAIGTADAASGRRALSALTAAGLVVVEWRDRVTGRWNVWMPDPRDALRRQASDGQVDFLADEPETETVPESSHVAGRVGNGPSAEAQAHPPRPPDPPETSAEAQAHPPTRQAQPPAEAPAHPPRRMRPSPHCPRARMDLADLDLDLEAQAHRDLDLARATFHSASSRSAQSRVGGTAGASAEAFTAAAAALAGGSVADDQAVLARRVHELRQKIPGLWLEIAEWVVAEVMELHGPTRFDHHELARAVSKTRGLLDRGKLRKPPAVYFASACETRFAELGRRWPKFQPGKPR